MTNKTAIAQFTSTALAADSAAKAPDWVQLFPAGPDIQARDGRRWTLQPAIVVAAFEANQGQLAIDYEHGQAHLAQQGLPAPAAGWITAVEERDGGVWGKVEWTKKAAQAIIEQEYRYLSPDFDHTEDGLIISLNGAGLVNRPALVMTALSRKSQTTEDQPMLKAIAKALGLPEDADEKAILSDLSARQSERNALCALLKIDEKSNSEQLSSAVTELSTKTETALASLKSQSSSELNALKTDLANTRTALAALQKKDSDREIDLALDAEVKAGKITPASRETYRAMCVVEGGLERFKALAATLPVICDPSGLGDIPGGTNTTGQTRDPSKIAALARKFQDDQAALGIQVTTSEAVAHVEATP